MTLDPALRYTNDEAQQLLTDLFPQGWAGKDVMEELAPAGWEQSPLVRIFHPTPQQQFEEAVRMHENLARLSSAREEDQENGPPSSEVQQTSRPRPEAPTLEKILAEYQPVPPEPEKEVRELVGRALWDIFSDNHEVTGPDGRIVDLGSFRGSGGFLAELANVQIGQPRGAAEEREMKRLERLMEMGPDFSVEALFSMLEEGNEPGRPYDYMDFYMGTQMVSGRADLTSVYGMIFRRLRDADCDWRYTFPRLYLFNLRPLKEQMKSQDTPDWIGYDPSAALAEECANDERNKEVEKMQSDLDESYREAVEEARHGPPPTTVAAYEQVFGSFPEGWPPQVVH
jgi:hypothetical protein